MYYLLFDESRSNGYRAVRGEKPTKYNDGFRHHDEYIPLATLRHSGEVVYGEKFASQQEHEAAVGRFASKMSIYSETTYRLRRKLCDSALGTLMINNPRFMRDALQRVNNGIRIFKADLTHQDYVNNGRNFVKRDGKYVANATSFGRLDEAPAGIDHKTEIERWMKWLKSDEDADVPKIMSLYDIFFKMYVRHKGESARPSKVKVSKEWNVTPNFGEKNVAESKRKGFREGWFDHKKLRGRKNRYENEEDIPESRLPGIVPGILTPEKNVPGGLKSLARAGVGFSGVGRYHMKSKGRRIRGMDRFKQAEKGLNPGYDKELKNYNLNFSASASGSTSTLLAAADAFAAGVLADTEVLRQYLMACVAYLVGGGMHTCNEVFYTVGISGIGLHHIPGTYLPMLPNTFKNDNLFKTWQLEFWDVIKCSPYRIS